MSRIGREPIKIPSAVKVKREDDVIIVEGTKGVLSRKIPIEIGVAVDEDMIVVTRTSDEGRVRSLHGLVRSLISNMVVGVSEGFQKALQINGVGYRGEVENNLLTLHVGFSNPVKYEIPDGISITIDKQVNLSVSGIDRELVGKVAAEIRNIKKPEPYKGKGIKYADEHIRRKVGKSAGA